MKLMRIIVSILFVFISIAALTVLVGNKMAEDKTVPVITVDGDILDVSIKATEEDLLAGVTAYDGKDKDLTDKIIVESVSRFTEKGVCKVTYAVCDSDNNVAKATRKIRYTDYVSPQFKVIGNLCFSLYEKMDIRAFITATDCIDGNVNKRIITTSNNFSNSVAGFYTIKATVTNSKGDYAEIDLPLIVEDRPLNAPVIELSEYLVFTPVGKKIDFASYVVDALDEREDSLKPLVKFESNVDFSKEGTYHVHYYVTDINGYRGHSVMTVIVGGEGK